MRILLLTLIFSTVCWPHSSLYAQDDRNADKKLNNLLPSSYGEKTWKLIMGLDATRSFYQGELIRINGIRIGAQYLGVHRFGIGVYALPKTLQFEEITATDTIQSLHKVQYSSLFYERVVHKSKRWELSMPNYFNAGDISGWTIKKNAQLTTQPLQSFVALSSGLQAKYYIFSWLAPRISFGYRFSFNINHVFKRAYNRPYLGYGVHILLGELYKTVFTKLNEPI